MEIYSQKDFNLFRKDRGISGVAMHDYQNKLTSIYGGYMNPTIIEERQMNVLRQWMSFQDL